MSGPIYGRNRRDEAEMEIVRVFRGAGAKVHPLSGRDVPDLLVGIAGVTVLVECKTNNAALTKGQQEWHTSWPGSKPYVIRNAAQARKLVALFSVRRSLTGGNT